MGAVSSVRTCWEKPAAAFRTRGTLDRCELQWSNLDKMEAWKQHLSLNPEDGGNTQAFPLG